MDNSDLKKLGLINLKAVYRNLPVPELIEHALARGEGKLAKNGSLSVITGAYTGRSPDDRFIVDEPGTHNDINWGKVNVPISEEKFTHIYDRLCAYMQGRDAFVFDGFSGADSNYRLPVRFINEFASQSMFNHQLFLRPTEEELAAFVPEFTMVCAPGFKCIPELDGVHSEAAILLSFKHKLIVIAGSQYAGENKKSIFSVMNYILPTRNVFPMHCSANVGKDGDVALFFGLSGTGKTTLSADPDRYLIGDDEHGWSADGVFNFEGGCYAKCIKLSHEHEPQIWDAIRFGTLVENVVMDPDTRLYDFDNDKYTENTRAGYPIDYIPNCVIPSVAGHPKTVIFLTADAFGVLPPISKLDKAQAMYHFVSGFTSRLAGTERGVDEPQPTFSTCFGAPFLPRHPQTYADLLGRRIDEHNSNVYLINTGWSGGPYGVGQRMSIKNTRAMVTAALNGQLEKEEFVLDPIFNVLVPKACPNVPVEVLQPINAWADKAAYEASARRVAKMFVDNFGKYKGMSDEIIAAGPKPEAKL